EEGGPTECQRNDDRVRPRADVTRLAGSRPTTPGKSKRRAARHPGRTAMAPVITEAKRKTADGGKAVAGPLSAEELRKMDAYFRALTYLIAQLPQLGARAACFQQAVEEKLLEHKQYIREHGNDMPEIAGWRWSSRDGAAAARPARRTSTEGDNV